MNNTEEIFKWRHEELEKPFYALFGHSNEVIGLNKEGSRYITRYVRGAWEHQVPVCWHYLPKRKK